MHGKGNRMNYRDQRNYENLTKRIYQGVGAYDIPQLEPVQFDREACEFIPFSAAARKESVVLGWMLRITAKRHGIISRDTEIRIIIQRGWGEWRSQLHKT